MLCTPSGGAGSVVSVGRRREGGGSPGAAESSEEVPGFQSHRLRAVTQTLHTVMLALPQRHIIIRTTTGAISAPQGPIITSYHRWRHQGAITVPATFSCTSSLTPLRLSSSPPPPPPRDTIDTQSDARKRRICNPARRETPLARLIRFRRTCEALSTPAPIAGHIASKIRFATW